MCRECFIPRSLCSRVSPSLPAPSGCQHWRGRCRRCTSCACCCASVLRTCPAPRMGAVWSTCPCLLRWCDWCPVTPWTLAGRRSLELWRTHKGLLQRSLSSIVSMTSACAGFPCLPFGRITRASQEQQGLGGEGERTAVRWQLLCPLSSLRCDLCLFAPDTRYTVFEAVCLASGLPPATCWKPSAAPMTWTWLRCSCRWP